jgi:hypothetical protein
MEFRINAAARLKATEISANSPEVAAEVLQVLVKGLGNKYKKQEQKFDNGATVFQEITWPLGRGKAVLSLKHEKRWGDTVYFTMSGDVNLAHGEGKTAKEIASSFIKSAQNLLSNKSRKGQVTLQREAEMCKKVRSVADLFKTIL